VAKGGRKPICFHKAGGGIRGLGFPGRSGLVTQRVTKTISVESGESKRRGGTDYAIVSGEPDA